MVFLFKKNISKRAALAGPHIKINDHEKNLYSCF